MSVPAFLTDKSVQGAIFVFFLGVVFVVAQIRVARQQLFASLADKRQRWYADYKQAIDDRRREIAEHLKEPLPPFEQEQLGRLWQAHDDAKYLFGPEIEAMVKAIEESLHDHAMIRWQLKEAHEDCEEERIAGSGIVYTNPTAKTEKRADLQKQWMENDRGERKMRQELSALINDYLYVGDVKRGVEAWKRRRRALRHPISTTKAWLAARQEEPGT